MCVWVRRRASYATGMASAPGRRAHSVTELAARSAAPAEEPSAGADGQRVVPSGSCGADALTAHIAIGSSVYRCSTLKARSLTGPKDHRFESESMVRKMQH